MDFPNSSQVERVVQKMPWWAIVFLVDDLLPLKNSQWETQEARPKDEPGGGQKQCNRTLALEGGALAPLGLVWRWALSESCLGLIQSGRCVLRSRW